MVEQKIKISKSILSTLNSYKQGNIDQNDLNKSLLKEICELLKLKNENKSMNYSVIISNKQLLDSFTHKIKSDTTNTSLFNDLTEIFDDKSIIIKDNVSMISSITRNFNELKKEKEKESNNKASEILDTSIALDFDFDNKSILSKMTILSQINPFDNNDITKGHISSLSKDAMTSFNKKCDKRILVILDKIYDKLLNRSKNSLDSKGFKILFIAIFKQMLLDIGFSLKKFYSDSVRRITMNISFSSFVNCFESIFSLESNYSFYKYKSKLLNKQYFIYLY